MIENAHLLKVGGFIGTMNPLAQLADEGQDIPGIEGEKVMRLLHRNVVCAALLVSGMGLFLGCGTKPQENPSSQAGLSLEETRAIAKEAYIYGFPVVTNYQTLYKQAVDKNSEDYRAPFNTVASAANVATPEDKFVVTPNSDTPYSFLWMDLRAEPIVVIMPKIEKDRYDTGQLIDLYTFNFAYLGTRSYGNEGGVFVIAGPGWKGETPKGVKAVLQSETEFAYLRFRTQLLNPADLSNVKKIQAGYHAQPLSQYLKQAAPPAHPAVNWPAPADYLRYSRI